MNQDSRVEMSIEITFTGRNRDRLQINVVYIIMGRYVCVLQASGITYNYETLHEGYADHNNQHT